MYRHLSDGHPSVGARMLLGLKTFVKLKNATENRKLSIFFSYSSEPVSTVYVEACRSSPQKCINNDLSEPLTSLILLLSRYACARV